LIFHPRTSLVVEGFIEKGTYRYDFYSMKFDKRTGETHSYKIYCSGVSVGVMYRSVSKHVSFMKKLIEEKEDKK